MVTNCRRARGRPRRRGMASMEAVLATAISLPVAVSLLYLAFRMCRFLYQAIAHLIGWPYF